MTNRRITALTITATFLVMLFLPATQASAQGNAPWWGRNRDNSRDRDSRYGNYDYRSLRDSARRVHDRSKSFERNVDRLLDDSRYDDSRREDRINERAQDFRETADRFKDRVGDGRNLNRSANEARALLQSAQQIDRILSRVRLDSRTRSDWSQITNDLRFIADIYGLRYRASDDYYDRDDDYNRRDRRDNRRGSNDRGWRWPF